jgi:hypothetical protein
LETEHYKVGGCGARIVGDGESVKKVTGEVLDVDEREGAVVCEEIELKRIHDAQCLLSRTRIDG